MSSPERVEDFGLVHNNFHLKHLKLDASSFNLAHSFYISIPRYLYLICNAPLNFYMHLYIYSPYPLFSEKWCFSVTPYSYPCINIPVPCNIACCSRQTSTATARLPATPVERWPPPHHASLPSAPASQRAPTPHVRRCTPVTPRYYAEATFFHLTTLTCKSTCCYFLTSIYFKWECTV
jgi:hypothetical protein